MFEDEDDLSFDALAELDVAARAAALAEAEAQAFRASFELGEDDDGEPEEDTLFEDGEPCRFNDDGTLSFIFSTEGRDRYNSRFVGWRLGPYKRNAVFLWMHNMWGLPIGRTVRCSVDDKKRLMGDVKFDEDEAKNPLGHAVARMYRERFLNACSIRARPRKRVWMADLGEDDPYYDKRGGILYRDNELLECSGVTLPGNAGALAQRDLAKLMPDWMKRLSPDGNLEALAETLRPLLLRQLLEDANVQAQLRTLLTAPPASPSPHPAPARTAPAPAPASSAEDLPTADDAARSGPWGWLTPTTPPA